MTFLLKENFPSHLLQTHLPTGKFTALYVDFKAKIIKRTCDQWQQDLVFVNNEFLSELLSLGYQLEDHAKSGSKRG